MMMMMMMTTTTKMVRWRVEDEDGDDKMRMKKESNRGDAVTASLGDRLGDAVSASSLGLIYVYDC